MPTGFINLGNGVGRQLEVISQKDIVFACFRVTIADSPEFDRAIEFGVMIRKDKGGRRD